MNHLQQCDIEHYTHSVPSVSPAFGPSWTFIGIVFPLEEHEFPDSVTSIPSLLPELIDAPRAEEITWLPPLADPTALFPVRDTILFWFADSLCDRVFLSQVSDLSGDKSSEVKRSISPFVVGVLSSDIIPEPPLELIGPLAIPSLSSPFTGSTPELCLVMRAEHVFSFAAAATVFAVAALPGRLLTGVVWVLLSASKAVPVVEVAAVGGWCAKCCAMLAWRLTKPASHWNNKVHRSEARTGQRTGMSDAPIKSANVNRWLQWASLLDRSHSTDLVLFLTGGMRSALRVNTATKRLVHSLAECRQQWRRKLVLCLDWVRYLTVFNTRAVSCGLSIVVKS